MMIFWTIVPFGGQISTNNLHTIYDMHIHIHIYIHMFYDIYIYISHTSMDVFVCGGESM